MNAGVDNMRVLLRAKDPVKMTEYKLGMVPIDLADVLHRCVGTYTILALPLPIKPTLENLPPLACLPGPSTNP